MKKLIALAAVASVAAFAAPAFAATSGSLGYSNYDIGGDSVGAVGARLSDNWGIIGLEAETSVGVTTDTTGTGANKEAIKLSWEAGLFGTAQYDVAKNFEVFARAGYGDAQFKASNGTGPTRTDTGAGTGGGVAWGGGAAAMFDASNGVRADYTHYDLNIDKHRASGTNPTASAGYDANVWSVSLVHTFK